MVQAAAGPLTFKQGVDTSVSVPLNQLYAAMAGFSVSGVITGTSAVLGSLSTAFTNGQTGSGAVVLGTAPTVSNPQITGGSWASGAFASPVVSNPQVTGGTFSNPALTGVPTAPTAAPGTNTTQIATTAFVKANSMIIKDIQRGTISITAGNVTATATITAVDVTKTELRYLGFWTNSATVLTGIFANIVLTNSTTITATRNGAAAGDAIVSWELTEWQ